MIFTQTIFFQKNKIKQRLRLDFAVCPMCVYEFNIVNTILKKIFKGLNIV